MPSPKFHKYETEPVLTGPVKETGLPTHPLGGVNVAVKAGIVTVTVAVEVHPKLVVTVSVTVKFPDVEKVCVGFVNVLVLFAPEPGSPKFQE